MNPCPIPAPPEVWVIDDEETVVEMTELILRKRWPELRIRSFVDSEKAWAALQRRQPDVVITGSQMPGLGGEQIVAGLHGMQARCRILVFSGLLQAGDWVSRYHGVRFLPKPFTPEEMHALVEQLLEGESEPPPPPKRKPAARQTNRPKSKPRKRPRP